MIVAIQIILLVLALVNTYWAWLRTKYAKHSLTLQRTEFKIKMNTPHCEFEEEEFKIGGTD